MNIKKVKVYATLGPACEDPKTLKMMFQEGMDGVRLNLSHTTLDDASNLVEAFHQAVREYGIKPELLIDMQGPELRIGRLKEPVCLNEGDSIDPADLAFPEAVQEALSENPSGQDILLDDGKILLITGGLTPDGGVCLRVVRGGMLESRKSIALPDCEIYMPALTKADRDQIFRANEFGVTAVMQPFVRSKEDLIEVRNALDQAGCREIRLLAKIESRDGIRKLGNIIPYCDEVVIARGDLGNAMELWELPAAQKEIAAACRAAGRDFMVVTQMLDSMMHRKVPTRAEVSDIFNAVLDGAASVMVTGETAAGENPVLVIRYLTKTVREAEGYIQKYPDKNPVG